MHAFGAVAARPRVGPLPSTASLGRRLTKADPARLRSLFTGQANAILLARRHAGGAAGSAVLNSSRFRRVQARWLRLDLVTRLYWAKERRVVHAVRVRFADGRRALVANLHATGSLRQAAAGRGGAARRLVRGRRRPSRTSCACSPATSTSVRPCRGRCPISAGRSGGSRSRARGSTTCSCAARRRRLCGRGRCAAARSTGCLLSDHAPVEVTVA